MVGPNDVLTAAHMVYSAVHGGATVVPNTFMVDYVRAWTPAP